MFDSSGKQPKPVCQKREIRFKDASANRRCVRMRQFASRRSDVLGRRSVLISSNSNLHHGRASDAETAATGDRRQQAISRHFSVIANHESQVAAHSNLGLQLLHFFFLVLNSSDRHTEM